MIHLVEAAKIQHTNPSAKNYTDVIMKTFAVHEKVLFKDSAAPQHLGAKVLVKCPAVKDIWSIREELMEKYKGKVHIFAGSSWSTEEETFYQNNEGMSKTKFLERIQELKNNDTAIILHYDILTEGIDVPGITGVMFLSKILPSLSTLIQTIGRSTRLHPIDRPKIFTGKLTTSERDKWVKPFCYVMIPVLSHEMEASYKNMAETLRKLRYEYDFQPRIIMSEGEDISFGDLEEPMKTLNENSEETSTISKSIGKLLHYIEEIQITEAQLIEENKRLIKNGILREEKKWPELYPLI